MCVLHEHDISAEDLFFFVFHFLQQGSTKKEEHLSLELERMPVSTGVIVCLQLCKQ